MPINYELGEISDDLEDFTMAIDDVDMEKVERKALKKAADDLAEMVRQQVFESGIQSPADKIGKYQKGPGPALAEGKAWKTEKRGDKWVVYPHPQVRQRAIVLNYGYPGTIDAGGDVMSFEVNGAPVFATEVEGPKAYGYWQKAYRRLRESGKVKDRLEEELNREIEESFR